MKRLGLDFVEAVKHVAQHAGVEIREVSTKKGEENPLPPPVRCQRLRTGLFSGLAVGWRFRASWPGRISSDAASIAEWRSALLSVTPRTSGEPSAKLRPTTESAIKTLLEAGLLTASERSEETVRSIPWADHFFHRESFREGLGVSEEECSTPADREALST